MLLVDRSCFSVLVFLVLSIVRVICMVGPFPSPCLPLSLPLALPLSLSLSLPCVSRAGRK